MTSFKVVQKCVIAMGTNKLNNHGDLKHRSLGWFIHIVTHIYIYMDVHLYPSGQQYQNHHHCVCGGMYLRAHMHASVCIWIWESILGVISWESSVLRFEAGSLIGTWDSLGWLSGVRDPSVSPFLVLGLKEHTATSDFLPWTWDQLSSLGVRVYILSDSLAPPASESL